MTSAHRRSTSTKILGAVVLVLGLLITVIYARTAGFGYVFDDEIFILRNPALSHGLSGAGLRWALTTTYWGNWYPVTWLAHLADAQFFGNNPGPAHVINALLHLAACLLLFVVLRRLTGAFWRSALAAAFFAVHPLRVESVAWITERKDPLSALFWLLAILAYLRYLERPGAARYALMVMVFVLGLMTKPIVVTLPFALLLLDWWPLGRFQARSHPMPILSLALEKLPLLSLSAGASVVAFFAQRAEGAVGSWEQFPLAVRLGNALVSYSAYLGKTFWPVDLAVYYPHQGGALPFAQVAFASLLFASLTVAGVFAARRRPWLTVGWFWYIGTLVPVIGVVQLGQQAMADRFSYLPSMGVAIALFWSAPALKRLSAPLQAAAAALVAVALVALTWRSSAQVGFWRDNATLYRHALEVTRDNWLMRRNYGATLAEQGDLEGAIREFRELLRIVPDYFPGRMGIARYLEMAAEKRVSIPGVPAPLEEAEDHYRRAAALIPGSPDVAVALSNLLAKTGRSAEAASLLVGLLRREPNIAVARMNLAILRAREGRTADAIALHIEAIRLDPRSAEARYNYGVTLELAGRTTEALREFRAALLLNPGYRDALVAVQRLRPGI